MPGLSRQRRNAFLNVGATDAWTLAMYYDIIAVRCVGAEKVANTFLTNDFSDPGYLEAAPTAGTGG